MITDFRTAATLPASADATVVIGAGAAGLAVALALADAGERVVVIESGSDTTDARATEPLPSAAPRTSVPLDGGDVSGITRTLGGTTALWHGQCMRLHEIDVEPRPWVDHSGWPIPLSDLDDHYRAAEAFLDVSGQGYGASRWEEHPGLPPIAWNEDRLLHDFTEYTPRPHLGHVHRPRLLAHPNIDVLVNATAGRVLVDGGRTSGVMLLGADRPAATLPARRVILAGGGIENARLLMLSDDDGVGLGHGRAHTGRYYQDHPIIRTAQVHSRDFRVLQDRYIALHRRGRRLFPKLRLSPKSQREHGLLDATAVFVHDHHDPARDALRRLIIAARYGRRPEQPIADALRSAGAPWAVLRDGWRRYVKGYATGAKPAAVWLQLWLEQQPDPDSRITLSDTTDAVGLRQARLQWRCSDLELHTSRTLTRWIARDLERLGLAKVTELPAMTDDVVWRHQVSDAAHPAGTTRMSRDGRDGVVDPGLQVHGIGNLYVVGSSVFPICGYANPTLTIVALALRLAQALRTASN